MKINLKSTLAAFGLVIAALAFSGCGTDSSSEGSHNMGNHRSYRPMPDADMPGH